MKVTAKRLLALGVLAMASTAAMATTTVPTTIDYTQPLTDFADDGTVLFHIYSTDVSSSSAAYSYTASLGLTLSQIQPSDMSTTLTWTLTGLSGIPTSVLSSGKLAWGINAINYDSGPPGNAAGSEQIATTLTSAGVASLATANNANMDVQVQNFNNEAEQINNNCATPGLCTTSSTSDTWYWTTTAGASLGQSGGLLQSDGALASSMAFYLLSNSSGVGTDLLNTAKYAGVWSLSIANGVGTLTYTVSAVPLPAAAWLLLSGLIGMGLVGRSKRLTLA